MNVWKILAGAAIGVGAVAAAPFTGGGSVIGAVSLAASLSGAGTIAAAVGAGAVGAAVGAGMGGDDPKEAREQGFTEGQKAAKAQNKIDLDALQIKLERAFEKLNGITAYFNAILAMEAVAVACANCDGMICEEERQQIQMFVAGALHSALPGDIKDKIQQLYEKPLNLQEAYALAVNSNIDMDVYDDIISLVVHADGIVHRQEKAFMQAWKTLRAA